VASLRELFGKRLRELRLERGFNQLYLAQLSGTSEDFISLVERGINAPSFETIEALALALDTDIKTLFTFSDLEDSGNQVRMIAQLLGQVRSR
jgi:transcriptional regulator with XRE-family HTH domain